MLTTFQESVFLLVSIFNLLGKVGFTGHEFAVQLQEPDSSSHFVCWAKPVDLCQVRSKVENEC